MPTLAPMILAQATTQPSADAVWNNLWSAVSATFEQTPWQRWLILLAAILAGFVIGYWVKKVLLVFYARQDAKHRPIRAAAFEAAASPLSLLLLLIGISVGLGGVTMSEGVRYVVARILALAYITGMGWLMYNAIDVIDLTLKRIAARTANNLDDQMVPLVRKALRLFLVIILALFTLDNVFNRDVSAWLAGLGIAGLAVTFAAQDTIKNFFGSLTILFDRPFQLGDHVVLDTHEGVIEDIGFRSIRLRRSDGVLVTIPNAKVVDQSIQNISRRRTLKRTFSVSLSKDTPIDKLQQAVALVREVLTDSAIASAIDQTYPPRVSFEDLQAGTRAIRVSYSFHSPDQQAFSEHAERINLAILERLSGADIPVS